jgi:hypothetical protein
MIETKKGKIHGKERYEQETCAKKEMKQEGELDE